MKSGMKRKILTRKWSRRRHMERGTSEWHKKNSKLLLKSMRSQVRKKSSSNVKPKMRHKVNRSLNRLEVKRREIVKQLLKLPKELQ